MCADSQRLENTNELETKLADELLSINQNFDYIPFDSPLNQGLPPNPFQSKEIRQRLNESS